jgi:hypothetical protein
VTPRARWVTLRARWVTLRARWVTLRARWVTLRARWVTLTQGLPRWFLSREGASLLLKMVETGIAAALLKQGNLLKVRLLAVWPRGGSPHPPTRIYQMPVRPPHGSLISTAQRILRHPASSQRHPASS